MICEMAVWRDGNLARQFSRRDLEFAQFVSEDFAGVNCGARHLAKSSVRLSLKLKIIVAKSCGLYDVRQT
jgi:hypothetical protein